MGFDRAIYSGSGEHFAGSAGGGEIRSRPVRSQPVRDQPVRGQPLSRADLYEANLTGTNLSGADLLTGGADLYGANLSRADLSRADLSRANLSGTNLSGANLSRADLSGANLSGTNLSGANLYGADLYGANLSRADLSRADYCPEPTCPGTNLSGVPTCPRAKNGALAEARTSIISEGNVVGWKKCQNGVIVKLLIPQKARRSNATGRKCRAEYATVLRVFGASEGVSQYDTSFIYRKGETVKPSSWEENRFIECGGGIHFYLTRVEAENN